MVRMLVIVLAAGFVAVGCSSKKSNNKKKAVNIVDEQKAEFVPQSAEASYSHGVLAGSWASCEDTSVNKDLSSVKTVYVFTPELGPGLDVNSAKGSLTAMTIPYVGLSNCTGSVDTESAESISYRYEVKSLEVQGEIGISNVEILENDSEAKAQMIRISIDGADVSGEASIFVQTSKDGSAVSFNKEKPASDPNK